MSEKNPFLLDLTLSEARVSIMELFYNTLSQTSLSKQDKKILSDEFERQQMIERLVEECCDLDLKYFDWEALHKNKRLSKKAYELFGLEERYGIKFSET